MKALDGTEVKNIATDIKAPENFQVGNLDEKLVEEIRTTTARNYHAGNTIKKEFDFVMQFRIEVEGDIRNIPIPTLARFMQNYGITCDEFVGKKDEDGKTPITFQFMISKEHYNQLEKHAKSGNPIRPFSGNDSKVDKIPEIIMPQLKGYLGLRLHHFTNEEDILKLDSATISVNEAPATYAKEVFKQAERNDGYKSSTKNPDVVLVGDAAMGLSYFKEINAGFESSARLVDIISQPHEQRKQRLEDYKKWFEEKYAPGPKKLSFLVNGP